MSYAVAVVVCFICDLAVFHRLDWFWIVLTSLMLAFCFTNLPFLMKKNRAAVCLGAATASLTLLLLSCWGFTGGGWWLLGALAITAASLALPWSVWALRRFYGRHMAVLTMAAFTAWVFLLLAIIRLFSGGDWLLRLACPIAALSLTFLWAGFSIIRWLPLRAMGKAGGICVLCALAAPAGQGLARHLAGGETVQMVDYLRWWRLFGMIRDGDLDWINLLVFVVLVVSGLVLLIVDGIRSVK